MAGDPGRPGRRQHARGSSPLLGRHRAGLELLVGRHRDGPGRLVRGHGVVQHVEGGTGRHPPGHEQGLQVTASDPALTAGAPPGAGHRPEPQQRSGVGELGHRPTRPLHQEQHQGDPTLDSRSDRASKGTASSEQRARATSRSRPRSARRAAPGRRPRARARWPTRRPRACCACGHDDDAVAGQAGPASTGRRRRANSANAGSKPPSSSQTSRRTSMPGLPTASTSARWSCWPWSRSPRSTPASRRPAAADGQPDLEQPRRGRPRRPAWGRRCRPTATRRAASSSRPSASRLRRAVVVQQPEPRRRRRPAARRSASAGRGQRHATRRTRCRGRACRTVTGTSPAQRRGRRQEVGAGVRGAGVDDHEPVGRPVWAASGVQRLRQPRGAVAGDQDGGDARCGSSEPCVCGGRRWARSDRHQSAAPSGVGVIRNVDTIGAGRGRRTQTARFFSLRRSRSDSPPQMPNRSSLARAYSRHSAADVAADADLLGLAGGAALLGEERLRVGLGAQGALLPGQLALVLGLSGADLISKLGTAPPRPVVASIASTVLPGERSCLWFACGGKATLERVRMSSWMTTMELHACHAAQSSRSLISRGTE